MADAQAQLVLKVNIQDLSKLKQVARQIDEIRKKSAGLGKMTTEVSKAKSAFTKMEKSTTTANQSMKKLGSSIKTVRQQVGMAQLAFKQWSDRMIYVQKRWLGFGKNIQWTGRQLSFGFTLPLVAASTMAVKTAMEIESSWIRVQKVYGDTIEESEKFAQVQRDILGPSVERLSMIFATHKKEVVDIMASWAAMGWTGKELAGIVQETMGFMVAGDIEAAEATEYLRSTVSIFNLTVKETHKALAQLNAIENATAAQMKDLGVAITKVGASARVANLDVAETAALIAQMRDAGVQASTAGQALKFIIARIGAPTKEAAEKVAAYSKAVGESTINMNGMRFQSKGFINRLKDLSETFVKLTDVQRINFAQAIVGKRQYSRFITVLEGITDETSAFSRAMEAALDPKIIERYEQEVATVLESAPAMWKRLKIAVENLGQSWGLIISQTLMPMVKWLIGLTMALRQLDPAVQKNVFIFGALIALLGPLLAYIGFVAQGVAVLALAFSSLSKALATNILLSTTLIATLLILFAAFKLNIGGMGDFVRGFIKNIKGLTFSLGKMGDVFNNSLTTMKEVAGQMDGLGEDMAEGLGDGLEDGLANFDNAALRSQMEQFGKTLQDDFLQGFSDVDLDVLNTAIGVVKQYYNDMISLNKMSVEEALKGIKDSVTDVAQAIASSKESGAVINLFDLLKDKIGSINAEMLQSVSAAQLKVGVLQDEFDVHKQIYEAARDEYNAQKDYIQFLSKTNKDISIEISTTEKKRMWEIKAKIKEVQKANLAEMQAEKRKALLLAKQVGKTKKELDGKEEELKIAKELLKIEQKIMQLRLGFLRAVNLSSTTGLDIGAAGMMAGASAALPNLDLAGIVAGASDFGGMSSDIGDNFKELTEKAKKLGDVVLWVGGVLAGAKIFKWLSALYNFKWASLLMNVGKLGILLTNLGVAAAVVGVTYIIKTVFEFWKGNQEITSNIDSALESTLTTMDNLRKMGDHQAAIKVGFEFSTQMTELDDALGGIQDSIKNGFLTGLAGAIGGFLIAGPPGALLGFAISATIPFMFDLIFDVSFTDFLVEFNKFNPVQIMIDALKKMPSINPFDYIFDMDKIQNQIVDSFRNLPSNLAWALSGVTGVIRDVFSDVSNFVSYKIPEIVRNIASWFGELPWRIANSIGDIGSAVWDKFSNMYGWFQTKIWQLMRDIGGWFSNLPQIIKENLWNIGNAIRSAFDSIYGNFQNWVWQLMRDIGSWFSNLPGMVSSSIRNTGGMLAERISNALWFQTGGIVPGGVSQSVPVIAHGREMILNRHQQSELFNLLDGQTQTSGMTSGGGGGGVNINNNFEFKVGNMIATPGEQRAFARLIEQTIQQDHNRRGPALNIRTI